jgi:hypothetical protein
MSKVAKLRKKVLSRFVNVDTVNSTDIVAVEAMHNESQPQGHDVTAAEHKEHLIMFCTNCKTNLGRLCMLPVYFMLISLGVLVFMQFNK